MTESAKVVPFGKYKGQPVEAMVEDKPYVEWLTGQPWFKEKYQPVYNVVINNFGDASETPEHNALQALFLEPEYRVAFLLASGGDVAGVRDVLTRNVDTTGRWLTDEFLRNQKRAEDYWTVANREFMQAEAWHAKVRATDPADLTPGFEKRLGIGPQPTGDAEYSLKQGDEYGTKADVFRRAALACSSFLDAPTFRLTSGVTFERDAVDVSMSVTLHAKLDVDRQLCVTNYYSTKPQGLCEFSDRWELAIEIKPTVADDYPATLRQMRRNGCPYLFVDRYLGTGATFDQVRKIFSTGGKKIVLKSDVDAAVEVVRREWTPGGKED